MSKSFIKKLLSKIVDPELGVSIVDLGLVRVINFTASGVEIKIILTSPGCPYGNIIVKDIKKAIAKFPDIGRVKVEVIRDKPWMAEMASEKVRIELDL